MSVSSLHADAKPSRPPDNASVMHLLEALAAGSCTQDEFLRKVQSLEGVDPELPWEVLSLLDQYLRRERISLRVYTPLKTQLQQRYMGYGKGAAPTITPTEAKPDESLRVGDILRGRYRLVDILRKAPAEPLFDAIDQLKVDVPDVSHRVAIQVIDKARQRDPEFLQRICRLQLLSHPGIERVIDIDEDRGSTFLVMEWLNGVPLQRLVDQNGGARLALPAVLTIIRGVAGALAYAHSRDVFHGDVRSGNVVITDVGDVCLRGFEIGDKDLPADAKRDRLAFSWLAYELLSGLNMSAAAGSGGVRNMRLRAPPGVTREQWRLLRDTITGREDTSNVLTAFAGDPIAVGPIALLQANVQEPARRVGYRDWIATGIVAAILAVAGYFVVTQTDSPLPRASAGSPAVSAPVPESAAVAADIVPAPAPPPTVSPVILPAVPVPVPVPTRALIDLPSDTSTVDGDQPVARVWVRRKGRLSGEVTFLWWTETGSAQVDRDFRQVSPRTETIVAGADGVELLVPLVPDSSRQQPRTFYVKIDDASPNSTLGDRTLMQVSIVPPGYEAPLEDPT